MDTDRRPPPSDHRLVPGAGGRITPAVARKPSGGLPRADGGAARHLATPAQAGGLVSSGLALEVFLRQVLAWTTRFADAEAASVVLLDRPTEELVIQVATGAKGREVEGRRFQRGEGVAGWVAELGEPRIVPDVRKERHFFDGIDRAVGFTTASILAVPLRVESEVLGVLEVVNKREGRRFDAEDLDLAAAVAHFAAVCLHRAGIPGQPPVAHRADRSQREWERVVVGRSPAMRAVVQQVDRVAPREVTVLLCGETGTGKGLIARLIHDRSLRRERPFLAVDCGAMPEGLWESELFGHRKGAFTGALQDQRGLFEAANGGTIFLDEIGNAPLALQGRLLQVLQEREVRRVGETQARPVDVRLIAATNQDLEGAVREGRFRVDLFYRLNVVPIRLPPLRERAEDIPALIDFFIEKYSDELSGATRTLSPPAAESLVAHAWPGNVREMENLIRRLMVMVEDEEIRPEHLPPEIGRVGGHRPPKAFSPSTPTAPSLDPADLTLERMERVHIARALEATQANQSRAAQLLGISREKLRYRMRKYGLRCRWDGGPVGGLAAQVASP